MCVCVCVCVCDQSRLFCTVNEGVHGLHEQDMFITDYSTKQIRSSNGLHRPGHTEHDKMGMSVPAHVGIRDC